MPEEAVYKSRGTYVDFPAASTEALGDVVTSGPLLGVAVDEIAAGSTGQILVEGVVAFAKEAATLFAYGERIWWDNATKKAVRQANSNTRLAAVCTKAAVNGDLLVWGKVVPDPQPLVFIVPFDDLAAGADLTDVRLPAYFRPSRVAHIDANFRAPAVGIDGSNQSVWTIKDADDNVIVTKTYTAGTLPPASGGQESLGTPSDTHGALAARESMKFSVTNGGTADLPKFDLVYWLLPDR